MRTKPGCEELKSRTFFLLLTISQGPNASKRLLKIKSAVRFYASLREECFRETHVFEQCVVS